MSRGLAITINILVLILYLLIFIFLDPIFLVVKNFEPSPLTLSTIKFVLLLVISFCMGTLSQIFTNTNYKRTYWDFLIFLKLAIIPIVVLVVISINPLMEIFLKFPVVRDNSAEFFYYIVSTRYLWILWIGFSLGTSIKFPACVSKRAFKHGSSGEEQ